MPRGSGVVEHAGTHCLAPCPVTGIGYNGYTIRRRCWLRPDHPGPCETRDATGRPVLKWQWKDTDDRSSPDMRGAQPHRDTETDQAAPVSDRFRHVQQAFGP